MSSGQQPSVTRRPVEFLLTELITAGIGLLSVWLSAKMMKRVFDPNSSQRAALSSRVTQIKNRLIQRGVHPTNISHLSEAEQRLLFSLVFPEDIDVDFDDVGGLIREKQGLKEIVVLPFLYPQMFGAGGGSGLLSPPKGVLLYGPPGTGKTMLAKALAKESHANFLSISPSSLLSKYLGETEAFVSAVFSLARRVAPTVIFIDEIDSMFSTRSSSDHEVHKNLKAEFMQLWDGLLTTANNHVIVMGATNRPYDIDPAIARRMPRSFEVKLPTVGERASILVKILAKENLDDDFDHEEIARLTEGYSGSDLKELCRMAMLIPVKEAIGRHSKGCDPILMRALRVADLREALKEGSRTEEKSSMYGQKVGEGDPFTKLVSELTRRSP